MGQIDFNSFKQRVQSNGGSAGTDRGPRVGFFALKQDKEQAIVRFLVDSPEDLEIFAGHRIAIGNSRRLVNCLREVGGPIDACPLCAAGERLEYKVFIRMIEYVKGEDGTIIPRARVWERPASYSNTINNLLEEYGPLSEHIFKITRNGAPGVRGTTYDITYGRPAVYLPELYPKDTSGFEGYSVLGTAVLNYDREKLLEIAETDPATVQNPSYAASNLGGAVSQGTPGASSVSEAVQTPSSTPVGNAPATNPYTAGRFNVPSAPRTAPVTPAQPGSYSSQVGAGMEAPRRRLY